MAVFLKNKEARDEYLKKHEDAIQSEVFVRSDYAGDDVADYIKFELDRRGWTRQELCDTMAKQGHELKYPTLITYMRGSSNPKANTLFHICEAFDYEMSEGVYNKLSRSWEDRTRTERFGQKSVRLVPAWIAPGMEADIKTVSRKVNQRFYQLQVDHEEIIPGVIVNSFSSYVNWLIQKDLARAVERGEISWDEPVEEESSGTEGEKETVSSVEMEELKNQLAAMQEQLAKLQKAAKKG